MKKLNYEKYLPSKAFRARVIIVAILGAVVLLVYHFWPAKSGPKSALSDRIIIVDPSIKVSDVIYKDSNANTIPDWEESLWGLDPSANGAENKKIIEEKRKTLAAANPSESGANAQPQDETDRLARQFFASFMALKESGNLNQNAIANLTSTIGQQVGNTDLPDTYTVADIHTSVSNKVSLRAYQSRLEEVVNQYADSSIGHELEIMAAAVENEDSAALSELSTVSDAYKSLAKDLADTAVPRSVATDHLNLANEYDKLGTAVKNMSMAISNPVVGTTGTVMYERYTLEIEQTVAGIKKTFIDNGILGKDAQ